MRIVALLSIFFCAAISLRAQTSVEIDLEEQMAYLLQNGRPVLASPISSGRYGHLTKGGSFKILEKERTHYSSMYGRIVADADADMPVPPGGKFIPAPMHYFMRFCGADGMHAGYLPGYPASHGCVRMPEQYAIAFFNSVGVGTPVSVFGRTPAGRYLLGPIAIRFSAASALRPADWSAVGPASTALVAVGSHDRLWPVVCPVFSAPSSRASNRLGFGRWRQRTLHHAPKRL